MAPKLSGQNCNFFKSFFCLLIPNRDLDFILLHLYGVAVTRLAEDCTLLLWSQLLVLPVLWNALKLKIDKKKKTKRSCYHCLACVAWRFSSNLKALGKEEAAIGSAKAAKSLGERLRRSFSWLRRFQIALAFKFLKPPSYAGYHCFLPVIFCW